MLNNDYTYGHGGKQTTILAATSNASEYRYQDLDIGINETPQQYINTVINNM